MASLLSRITRRVRDAENQEEAEKVLDALMPAGEPDGDEGDQHIHVHLDRGGANGGDQTPPPMPAGGGMGGGGAGPDMTGMDQGMETPGPEEIMQMIAELSQRVEALENGESDVELESEGEDGTKDARRFKLRRGDALVRTGDDGPDIPTPDRNEEMMGETDLPGINDLDADMPTKTGDRRAYLRKYARTRDSVDMEDVWRETMAAAEVIQPGVKVPTFDARLSMERTAGRICAFRRRVMDSAMKDTDTKALVEDTLGTISVKTLDCDTLKMAFTATANAIKQNNNRSYVRASVGDSRPSERKGPPSIAEMNQRAKDFWNKRNSNGALH